jgi:hypothetical protein
MAPASRQSARDACKPCCEVTSGSTGWRGIQGVWLAGADPRDGGEIVRCHRHAPMTFGIARAVGCDGQRAVASVRLAAWRKGAVDAAVRDNNGPVGGEPIAESVVLSTALSSSNPRPSSTLPSSSPSSSSSSSSGSSSPPSSSSPRPGQIELERRQADHLEVRATIGTTQLVALVDIELSTSTASHSGQVALVSDHPNPHGRIIAV